MHAPVRSTSTDIGRTATSRRFVSSGPAFPLGFPPLGSSRPVCEPGRDLDGGLLDLASEANGARWSSRSSKPVAPRVAGGLSSTLRRFRHRFAVARRLLVGRWASPVGFAQPAQLSGGWLASLCSPTCSTSFKRFAELSSVARLAPSRLAAYRLRVFGSRLTPAVRGLFVCRSRASRLRGAALACRGLTSRSSLTRLVGGH
jgi:hypothetical protein